MADVIEAKPGFSLCASRDGKLVEVPDLVIGADRIYGYVNGATAKNHNRRRFYFYDHSLDWCTDQILAKGMVDIDHSIELKIQNAENRASGDLLRVHGLTPKQAEALLKLAIAQGMLSANGSAK